MTLRLTNHNFHTHLHTKHTRHQGSLSHTHFFVVLILRYYYSMYVPSNLFNSIILVNRMINVLRNTVGSIHTWTIITCNCAITNTNFLYSFTDSSAVDAF